MTSVPRRVTETEYPRWIILLERLLCAGLYYSGLNWIYRWLFRKNQCLVLMYHRVVDPGDEGDLPAHLLDPRMYVTKQTFAMHMQYLARHYHVIDAAHLLGALRSGENLPANACVITFDDGWIDTYTCAFPVLKRHDLPALVFLVTDYVGTNRWFWPEKTMLLLSKYLAVGGSKAPGGSEREALADTGLDRILAAPRLTPTQKVVASIEFLKTRAPADRDLMIHKLEGALAAHHIEREYAERLIVNWDEVAEMSTGKITFGAHTKTHPILTQIPTRDAAVEIAESRAALEGHLGTPCAFFCYPNGNYNAEIKEQVMAHYRGAFSVRPGFVRSGDDPFSLNRIGVRDAASFTRALFACKTSGIHHALMRAMRKICWFS